MLRGNGETDEKVGDAGLASSYFIWARELDCESGRLRGIYSNKRGRPCFVSRRLYLGWISCVYVTQNTTSPFQLGIFRKLRSSDKDNNNALGSPSVDQRHAPPQNVSKSAGN